MKLWHIISLLVTSALLTGCGKDVRIDVPEGPSPIKFTTGETAITRAFKPDDPTVLFTVGNKASVFATRVQDDIPANIMTNRELHCDEVTAPATPGDPYTGVWNYDNVVYWQDTGHYYFTSVFPKNDYATIDNSTYNLGFSYSAGTNTDIMVARAYRNASESQDPVNLEFKHITSAVRFLFGKSSSSDTDQYALTSFQLENIVATGNFSLLTRITNPASDPITSSNWSNSGYTTTLAGWSAQTIGDRITITHPSDPDNPDGYTPMGWYYMVPQTLNASCRVRFSVVYNDGDPVETVLNFYGAADQTSEAGIAWEPNHVYNYFITLTQSGLELTVQAVPWDQVNVTTDDIIFM